MKKDSLFYFENIFELRKFTENLLVFKNWKIKDGLMNERGSEIADKPYTTVFRERFKEKGFFRKTVSLAEIVTWIDNISIVLRVFEKLEHLLPPENFNDISISIEYCILMSKNMRIDFILYYGESILLLEMRTLNGFARIRSEWNKKFNELIIYKELLSNYTNYNNVVLYAFIALYEYSEKKLVPAHKNYNNNQINFFAEYINRFLICKSN